MNLRRLIVFLHDVAAAAIAWMLAFWLRFNLDIPAEYERLMLHLLPWVGAIYAIVFWLLGLYRGLWRYASLPDLQRIIAAVAVAALAVPAAFSFFRLGFPVPRSAYLLTPVFVLLIVGGDRLAYRAWREGRLIPAIAKPQATPVLVLGGGSAAAGLLNDLARSDQWRVV